MSCECRAHDWIELTGVTGFGRHGLLATERKNGQEFSVDLRLGLQLAAAGERDDVALTVDYAEVAAAVHRLIVGPPMGLIEALAERIARVALAYPHPHVVEVTVHKPQAPIPVPFNDVAVRITRWQDSR